MVFPPLPQSAKSTLSGDTVQIPNVTAYFSDHYRTFTTDYYSNSFQEKSNLLFPPIKLNHPPEYAFVAIKKHTDSTYLEEYLYPLKSSLYVNGFEPFYEDGTAKFLGSVKLVEGTGAYYTKATLRYYESPLWARLITGLGIMLSIYLLWQLGKRIFKYG